MVQSFTLCILDLGADMLFNDEGDPDLPESRGQSALETLPSKDLLVDFFLLFHNV